MTCSRGALGSNQHQSAVIRSNQQQSAAISSNQQQLEGDSMTCSRGALGSNQHQSAVIRSNQQQSAAIRRRLDDLLARRKHGLVVAHPERVDVRRSRGRVLLLAA